MKEGSNGLKLKDADQADTFDELGVRTRDARFKRGHGVGGGAPFIPTKAAQWNWEPKQLDFLA